MEQATNKALRRDSRWQDEDEYKAAEQVKEDPKPAGPDDGEALVEAKPREWQRRAIWLGLGLMVFWLALAAGGYLKRYAPLRGAPPRNPALADPRDDVETRAGFSPRSPPQIWMVWTTNSSTFRGRNWAVLDSYLWHHPNARVTVLATELPIDHFCAYTKQGYSVQIERMAALEFAGWTPPCPGANWTREIERWAGGPYFYSHATDFVRFCVLLRRGGVYTDLDAVLLQPLPASEAFIGRDIVSSAPTECPWCLHGGREYLAPGLMAAPRGHQLPRSALKLGFDAAPYDPLAFNAVGPRAVTQAYATVASARRHVDVLPPVTFYPVPWDRAHELVSESAQPVGELDRLALQSISMHLYGHATGRLPVDPRSVFAAASLRYSLWLNTEKPTGGPTLSVSWPFVSVERREVSVPFLRLVGTGCNGQCAVHVSVRHGLLSLGTSTPMWAASLKIAGDSPQSVNRQLATLVHIPSANSDAMEDALTAHVDGNAATLVQVPIYYLEKLVTVIVKTMGRLDKALALVESVRARYRHVRILVGDDGDDAAASGRSGRVRGFEYLPLPVDVGLAAGRNLMLAQVTTPFFLTLDDDFVLDATGDIGYLVHACIAGGLDMAAGRSIDDEERFGVAYSGFLETDRATGTLRLLSGDHGEILEGRCRRVDIVPNLFVGNTTAVREVLGGWDDRLKLGEHEDFFLRAKQLGLRTGTCHAVSFRHRQEPYWEQDTPYARRRRRIYEFWPLALAKHGLERIVAFGHVTFDALPPPPARAVRAVEVLATSARLTWRFIPARMLLAAAGSLERVPQRASFRVLVARSGRRHQEEFKLHDSFEVAVPPENALRGLAVERLVSRLQPATNYIVRVLAGNGFVFETEGCTAAFRTLSMDQQRQANALVNADFGRGSHDWMASPGATFHVALDGDLLVGRLQVSTRAYAAASPAATAFWQTVPRARLFTAEESAKARVTRGWRVRLVGASRPERLFGEVDRWALFVEAVFDDGRRWRDWGTFTVPSGGAYSSSTAELCLSSNARLVGLLAGGWFSAHRGSVYFRDFVLTTFRV